MGTFLLRPKWLAFHLLVVTGIVAMINLGFWQLRRLDERRDFNATVEARFDEPVVALDTLLGPGVDPDDIEWRPVTASGTYVPDEGLVVVNRSQNGRAGENVVTPLRLDDGRILLVNRGFVPLGTTVTAPPSGVVTVEGIARPSEERRTGQLSDPAEGELTEVQRLDLERLAPQLPGEVVPVYVDLLRSSPADDPALQPVTRPDLSEGSHLSYAVQWFIFSAAVAVGWVLAVRRSIAVRRRRASAPGDGADPPPSGDDAATTAPSGTAAT
jgi:cytochrome oxidase assembly protein ShyY1